VRENFDMFGGFYMKKDYTIINEETGEILELDIIKDKQSKSKITKAMVDNMLENASCLEEIDVDLLYRWLIITKEMNRYNQIHILGHYITLDYLRLSYVDTVLYAYSSRMVEFANTYTNILMKNHKTPFRTWGEIYEVLKITNTNTQTKFKKFCETHDLIRVDKTLRTKDNNKFTTRFILNPFLVRKCSHIGQIAIGRYQDYAKEGITINTYAYRFLQCFGVIDDFE
jgi:hypothetical protein